MENPPPWGTIARPNGLKWLSCRGRTWLSRPVKPMVGKGSAAVSHASNRFDVLNYYPTAA